MKKKDFLMIKILFHVYNRLIMILLLYYALLLEFKFFYFLFSCPFSYIKSSLNISAHLSMKIIFVDPDLVRTFFGNNFFDPNYGAHN